MQNWIIEMIEKFGYLGVFLLILLENIFPPIPSELILTFSGFMTTISRLNTLGVIVVSTLASYIGAVILYLFGKTVDKTKNILGFKRNQIDKSYDYFMNNGYKTVFLGRLVPVVRSIISIPAGMCRMSFVSFSLYTLLGTLLWNSILTILGILAGHNWSIVSDFIDRYSIIILLIVIVGFLIRKISKKD